MRALASFVSSAWLVASARSVWPGDDADRAAVRAVRPARPASRRRVGRWPHAHPPDPSPGRFAPAGTPLPADSPPRSPGSCWREVSGDALLGEVDVRRELRRGSYWVRMASWSAIEAMAVGDGLLHSPDAGAGVRLNLLPLGDGEGPHPILGLPRLRQKPAVLELGTPPARHLRQQLRLRITVVPCLCPSAMQHPAKPCVFMRVSGVGTSAGLAAPMLRRANKIALGFGDVRNAEVGGSIPRRPPTFALDARRRWARSSHHEATAGQANLRSRLR